MNWYYRVSQFLRGLGAKVTPEEVASALRLLPPGGATLFLQMPLDAQRHSLNVLYWLAREGDLTEDLAVAALLHDCGKIASEGRIGLWTRGPLVLLEAIAPSFANRLARPYPAHGWRHTLWVQREHAAIGAEWVRQCGGSEEASWLIAHHQDSLAPPQPHEPERIANLRRLQHADGSN